jgi:N-acyl-D-amino-acid deacylase
MRFLLVALLALTCLTPLVAQKPKVTYIRGGTVHAGDGQPGKVLDLILEGDKITYVGKIPADAAKPDLAIDATGFVVCPGFIDLHTHCDSGITGKVGKANKNYTTQGCTTIITGNCGSGPYLVGEFFTKLEAGKIGCNVIHLAPHNDIREKAMGNSNRAPTAAEQAKMETLLEAAMTDGAWGLSTGLIYTPGTYAKTEEIIALAKVAHKHGGIYASHIRNEGGALLAAIEEAMKIGSESGCPVHISHIKASGQESWGQSGRAVGLIEKARAAGQKVTADQYPYIASSTSLKATVVSNKFRDGTSAEYIARFDDPIVGPKLKADITKAVAGRDGGKRIQIARYAKNPKWQGKTLSQIAEMEGKEPADIAIEIEKNGGAQTVNFAMNEEDVRIYMKQPWVATASDGGVQTPGDTVPHPRSYGTFPRKIGKYSIEDGVIPLEQAIRSSTGLPADILGLKDRGYVKVGNFADLVIFDPKTYRDTATFDKPHQYASGVKYVFVNGVAVVEDGKHLPESLPGKVLRRK